MFFAPKKHPLFLLLAADNSLFINYNSSVFKTFLQAISIAKTFEYR